MSVCSCHVEEKGVGRVCAPQSGRGLCCRPSIVLCEVDGMRGWASERARLGATIGCFYRQRAPTSRGRRPPHAAADQRWKVHICAISCAAGGGAQHFVAQGGHVGHHRHSRPLESLLFRPPMCRCAAFLLPVTWALMTVSMLHKVQPPVSFSTARHRLQGHALLQLQAAIRPAYVPAACCTGASSIYPDMQVMATSCAHGLQAVQHCSPL